MEFLVGQSPLRTVANLPAVISPSEAVTTPPTLAPAVPSRQSSRMERAHPHMSPLPASEANRLLQHVDILPYFDESLAWGPTFIE